MKDCIMVELLLSIPQISQLVAVTAVAVALFLRLGYIYIYIKNLCCLINIHRMREYSHEYPSSNRPFRKDTKVLISILQCSVMFNFPTPVAIIKLRLSLLNANR